jgi:GTPase involved in cell partitioning and DNA repair
VVLNKLDLPASDENARIFQEAFNVRDDSKVFFISALERSGVNRVISKLLELLDLSHE